MWFAHHLNRGHVLYNVQNMELNTLIRVLCMRGFGSQCSKDLVRLLSIINVYLREKTTIESTVLIPKVSEIWSNNSRKIISH